MSAADSASEHLCVRCARLQNTCCQYTEVYCSPADVRRIAAATGRDDFHERRPPSDPDQLPEPGADPLWARLFAADGSRRVVRHRANGDCVFLGTGGCALAMETRPVMCRLYPYQYNHEAITGVDAHRCPPEARDNPALALALLAMDRDLAEAWRRRLYDEIAEDFD